MNKIVHPDLTEGAVVENVSIENDVIVVTLFTEPTTDHDEAVEAVYEALETSEQPKIFQDLIDLSYHSTL